MDNKKPGGDLDSIISMTVQELLAIVHPSWDFCIPPTSRGRPGTVGTLGMGIPGVPSRYAAGPVRCRPVRAGFARSNRTAPSEFTYTTQDGRDHGAPLSTLKRYQADEKGRHIGPVDSSSY
ncbi:hypothetical protein Taro_004459 [Colocasia esculenta]|uniref:Uncharacterized protein n=1 Tax=Colocasia esculenta TaxID=4460 RepID=A0A843TRQ8_COLES|nr:hypothetical protein [Colocasia esculenta]